MICWLASYPKSGNTYLRALLASYFFTQDGNFNFEILKNIKYFPHANLFKSYNINIEDENEVIKNYIQVQENINKKYKKTALFVKTHSSLEAINNYHFTNLKNSIGVIYVVRDPRNIVKSYSNHYQCSLEKSSEDMLSRINLKGMEHYDKFVNKVFTHVGSWANNYNSWKEFKKYKKYLLIKYEDLVSNPEKIFLDVLNFLSEITRSKIKIDEVKLNNVIISTKFDKLKNLEEKHGFIEALKDKNGRKLTFFKYGSKNNWKETLPEEIRKKLEHSFQIELEELGYL